MCVMQDIEFDRNKKSDIPTKHPTYLFFTGSQEDKSYGIREISNENDTKSQTATSKVKPLTAAYLVGVGVKKKSSGLR